MLLSFSQYFDKEKQKPTFFAEKILIAEDLDGYKYSYSEGWCKKSYNGFYDYNFEKVNNCKPKIHTIREDLKNRWKTGKKIHAVYNNRQKNRVQFVPTFLCEGIQRIEIKYNHGKAFVTIYDKESPSIWIHDFKSDYIHPDILKVAVNDGFENISDFFDWFNTDFKGKIIHFTDFRY